MYIITSRDVVCVGELAGLHLPAFLYPMSKKTKATTTTTPADELDDLAEAMGEDFGFGFGDEG